MAAAKGLWPHLAAYRNGCDACERSCTSKLRSAAELDAGVASLGFRGEALASIADCSLLEVTSKAARAFETHAKLLRGGAVLRQGLALQQRERQGTSVAVRDFLFNRPINRRALLEAGCGPADWRSHSH